MSDRKKSYKEGHIPTAKSYASSVITDRLDELPKNQYLIIYCETGGRAQSVIKKLEKQEYTKMMNWGGYTRWLMSWLKNKQNLFVNSDLIINS